ncbi:hypothetical protein [Selenomonas bovis]|uniref:hypothetical protein n=1 Tax=Selenomonas bovis TaxID=416586 RepID=UPI003AB930FC
MGYKHKHDIKDFMWSMFWMTHEVQKADIDQLEDDIKTLIKMTTQKTAGQRKDKMKDISWDNLERIQMNIICGATVLYLTGCLDELRKIVGQRE